MAFNDGLLSKALSWVKPQSAATASNEAAQMAKLRRAKRLGTPYASLEPGQVNRDFNASGFQRGTKAPKTLE
jgi:hypothetical protein